MAAEASCIEKQTIQTTLPLFARETHNMMEKYIPDYQSKELPGRYKHPAKGYNIEKGTTESLH